MKASCKECEFTGDHKNVLQHCEDTKHGIYVYGDGKFQRTVNIKLDKEDFKKELLKIYSKNLVAFVVNEEISEYFDFDYPEIEGDDIEDALDELKKDGNIKKQIIAYLNNLKNV